MHHATVKYGKDFTIGLNFACFDNLEFRLFIEDPFDLHSAISTIFIH